MEHSNFLEFKFIHNDTKWPSSGEIKKEEFDYVHSKILEVVKEKWKQWNNNNSPDKKEPFPIMYHGFSEKLHGYGKFDPSKEGNENRVSVETVLQKDTNVENFIKKIDNLKKYQLGYNLYRILYLHFNSKDKLNKPRPKKVLDKILLNVYFVFLGHHGIKDFRRKVSNGVITLPTFSPSAEKNSTVLNSNFYIGFFYSKLSRKAPIRTFLLENSTTQLDNGNFSATEIGYHNIGNHHDDDEFIGESYQRGEFIYYNLEYNGKQINIIGVLGDRNQKIVRTTIQSVSSSSKLLSSEALLVKIEKATRDLYLNSKSRNPTDLKIVTKYQLKNISFYLSFKRNTYHIENNIINRFENLKVKGKRVADYGYLVGQYRIWNFTFNNKHHIVQSRFTIYPDGTALLEPYLAKLTKKQKEDYPPEYEILRNNSTKHNCVISVDTISSKIWVLAYPEDEIKSIIANIAIFNYPNKMKNDVDNTTSIINGSFSSIGINPSGIISGYVVMIKDDRLFPVKGFSKKEISIYAKDNKLNGFRKALYELWKAKLWNGYTTKKKEEIKN